MVFIIYHPRLNAQSRVHQESLQTSPYFLLRIAYHMIYVFEREWMDLYVLVEDIL